MLLRDFFDDQIDQLQSFFAGLEERVRCVQVAPDIREFAVKVIAGQQDDPAYHHVMMICEAPFESADQYCGAVLDAVREALEAWRVPLEESGIDLRWPEAQCGPWREPERLARCASALADSLPEETGALLLVLLPASVADASEFRSCLEYLALQTESMKAKFLLVDEQKPPVFPVLTEEEQAAKRVGVQPFALTPAVIEADIQKELADPTKGSPRERRQYLAMLGSFAFARHDYAEAQQLQEDLLATLGPDGPGDERASAFYNLGNTVLAAGDAPTAAQCFEEALDLALDHRANALVPMALTNLGVALHRQGNVEEALEAFRVAQQTCIAQDCELLEAHVLDALARVYRMENRTEEAEACWEAALGVYNRLQSSAAAPIRQAGQADVVEKLKQLYHQTLQPAKLHELEAAFAKV